jgi:hypothetical protein
MGKNMLINYNNNIFWTQIQIKKIYMVFLKYFQIKYFLFNITQCHLTFILKFRTRYVMFVIYFMFQCLWRIHFLYYYLLH